MRTQTTNEQLRHSIDLVNEFNRFLREKHGVGLDDILKSKRMTDKHPSRIIIPLSIFTDKLGPLECIVKYLKENLSLKYSVIASILNRDPRTIWSTYQNSLKRYKRPLRIEQTVYDLDASIFKERHFSILETIVIHLSTQFNFSSKEISNMINRNESAIKTVFIRVKKKGAIL